VQVEHAHRPSEKLARPASPLLASNANARAEPCLLSKRAGTATHTPRKDCSDRQLTLAPFHKSQVAPAVQNAETATHEMGGPSLGDALLLCDAHLHVHPRHQGEELLAVTRP